MTFDEARREVRTWGQKVTPYRVGIAMGRSYVAIFRTWRDAAKVSHNYANRPEPPKCPYTINVSIRCWEDGFKREVRGV